MSDWLDDFSPLVHLEYVSLDQNIALILIAHSMILAAPFTDSASAMVLYGTIHGTPIRLND